MIKILLIQEWWFFLVLIITFVRKAMLKTASWSASNFLGISFWKGFKMIVWSSFLHFFFQIINVNNNNPSGVNMNNILSGGNINQDFMTVIWTNHPNTCPPNVLIHAYPQIIKSFRWIVDLKVLDHALHVEQEELVLGDHKERQGDPEYRLYALR